MLLDVKPDNVLVNYGVGDIRFTDVQLADMGSTVPANSAYAKDGDMIGAPIWRSPEAHLQIGWDTPTDIWSFGALVSVIILDSLCAMGIGLMRRIRLCNSWL